MDADDLFNEADWTTLLEDGCNAERDGGLHFYGTDAIRGRAAWIAAHPIPITAAQRPGEILTVILHRQQPSGKQIDARISLAPKSSIHTPVIPYMTVHNSHPTPEAPHPRPTNLEALGYPLYLAPELDENDGIRPPTFLPSLMNDGYNPLE